MRKRWDPFHRYLQCLMHCFRRKIMTVWIETASRITVLKRVRSAHQGHKVVHVVDQHGAEKVLDGTLTHCAWN